MRPILGVLKLLLIIAVVVAIGLLAVVWNLGGRAAGAESIESIQAEGGIPVKVGRPVRLDFPDYVVCDGEVTHDVRAVIRAQVEEVLEAVHARVGDSVRAGQVLVEFRTGDIEAEIAAAEAARDEARNNFERYTQLFEQEVIAPDQLDQARTALELAEAQLEASQSRLAFTSLTSPIDGYVAERHVEPGEYLSPGNPMLTIVDLSSVEVQALVPEQDVRHLALGMEAEFRLEGAEQWQTGTIARLSPSTSDPNRFFDVFVQVENEKNDDKWLLRPGMYAEFRCARDVARDALALASSAIVYEGDQRVAYVVEEATEEQPVAPEVAEPEQAGRFALGWQRLLAMASRADEAAAEPEQRTETVQVQRARRVPVQVGRSRQGMTQIIGQPMATDAVVVLNPRDAIHDGTRVRVISREAD